MILIRIRRSVTASALAVVIAIGMVACTPSGANTSPTADAGPDQSVAVGEPVELDASGSTDADGDPLAYGWEITSRPAGSNVDLVGAATATPSFTPDVVGAYLVIVEVSDGTASDSDEVTVSATDDPPRISSIEEQRAVQGEPLEVAFTIEDESPDDVAVTATSSDTTLVARERIEVLGTGADRTLRLTPDPLGTGRVDITLTAIDATGKTATRVVTLRVEVPFPTSPPVLTAGDAANGDWFGKSVAIDGDHIVVGAIFDDHAGVDSGSAYVFRRDGETWGEVAKLTARDAAEGDRFGYSVAIDGDHVIVGALNNDAAGDDAGAAYIYRDDGGTWSEVTRITASDAAAGDIFGVSLAIGGEYAVVGAPNHDGIGLNAGAAYVFRRSGAAWTEIALLSGSDTTTGDGFGQAVAIDGDRVIVGAPGDDDNGAISGSAYVFRRSGDAWVETGKLIASDGGELDRFGSAVSISGGHAIVGAYQRGEADTSDQQGAAYIFRFNGSTWTEVAALTASEPGTEGDRFGASVTIWGHYALVGAPDDTLGGSASTGSAYVYRDDEGTWRQVRKLTGSNPSASELFGEAVALGEGFAVVGAPRGSGAVPASGSVYAFPK